MKCNEDGARCKRSSAGCSDCGNVTVYIETANTEIDQVTQQTGVELVNPYCCSFTCSPSKHSATQYAHLSHIL